MVRKYLIDEYGDINIEFIAIVALCIVGSILSISYGIKQFNKSDTAKDKFIDLVESEIAP